MQVRAVALEWRCIVVDRRCRESEGKVKIEGYMSISDEEAHQWYQSKFFILIYYLFDHWQVLHYNAYILFVTALLH